MKLSVVLVAAALVFSSCNCFKKMAKNLVAAGADVVVGGHQHVVLPSEWVEAKGAEKPSSSTRLS